MTDFTVDDWILSPAVKDLIEIGNSRYDQTRTEMEENGRRIFTGFDDGREVVEALLDPSGSAGTGAHGYLKLEFWDLAQAAAGKVKV